MAEVTTEKYKRQLDITAAFNVSTSVITKSIKGLNTSLWVLSGNVWVDFLGRTDLTTLNGLKCTAGTVVEFNAPENITLVSDATGASVEYIRWEG